MRDRVAHQSVRPGRVLKVHAHAAVMGRKVRPAHLGRLGVNAVPRVVVGLDVIERHVRRVDDVHAVVVVVCDDVADCPADAALDVQAVMPAAGVAERRDGVQQIGVRTAGEVQARAGVVGRDEVSAGHRQAVVVDVHRAVAAGKRQPLDGHEVGVEELHEILRRVAGYRGDELGRAAAEDRTGDGQALVVADARLAAEHDRPQQRVLARIDVERVARVDLVYPQDIQRVGLGGRGDPAGVAVVADCQRREVRVVSDVRRVIDIERRGVLGRGERLDGQVGDPGLVHQPDLDPHPERPRQDARIVQRDPGVRAVVGRRGGDGQQIAGPAGRVLPQLDSHAAAAGVAARSPGDLPRLEVLPVGVEVRERELDRRGRHGHRARHVAERSLIWHGRLGEGVQERAVEIGVIVRPGLAGGDVTVLNLPRPCRHGGLADDRLPTRQVRRGHLGHRADLNVAGVQEGHLDQALVAGGLTGGLYPPAEVDVRDARVDLLGSQARCKQVDRLLGESLGHRPREEVVAALERARTHRLSGRLRVGLPAGQAGLEARVRQPVRIRPRPQAEVHRRVAHTDGGARPNQPADGVLHAVVAPGRVDEPRVRPSWVRVGPADAVEVVCPHVLLPVQQVVEGPRPPHKLARLAGVQVVVVAPEARLAVVVNVDVVARASPKDVAHDRHVRRPGRQTNRVADGGVDGVVADLHVRDARDPDALAGVAPQDVLLDHRPRGGLNSRGVAVNLVESHAAVEQAHARAVVVNLVVAVVAQRPDRAAAGNARCVVMHVVELDRAGELHAGGVIVELVGDRLAVCAEVADDHRAGRGAVEGVAFDHGRRLVQQGRHPARYVVAADHPAAHRGRDVQARRAADNLVAQDLPVAARVVPADARRHAAEPVILGQQARGHRGRVDQDARPAAGERVVVQQSPGRAGQVNRHGPAGKVVVGQDQARTVGNARGVRLARRVEDALEDRNAVAAAGAIDDGQALAVKHQALDDDVVGVADLKRRPAAVPAQHRSVGRSDDQRAGIRKHGLTRVAAGVDEHHVARSGMQGREKPRQRGLGACGRKARAAGVGSGGRRVGVVGQVRVVGDVDVVHVRNVQCVVPDVNLRPAGLLAGYWVRDARGVGPGGHRMAGAVDRQGQADGIARGSADAAEVRVAGQLLDPLASAPLADVDIHAVADEAGQAVVKPADRDRPAGRDGQARTSRQTGLADAGRPRASAHVSPDAAAVAGHADRHGPSHAVAPGCDHVAGCVVRDGRLLRVRRVGAQSAATGRAAELLPRPGRRVPLADEYLARRLDAFLPGQGDQRAVGRQRRRPRLGHGVAHTAAGAGAGQFRPGRAIPSACVYLPRAGAVVGPGDYGRAVAAHSQGGRDARTGADTDPAAAGRGAVSQPARPVPSADVYLRVAAYVLGPCHDRVARGARRDGRVAGRTGRTAYPAAAGRAAQLLPGSAVPTRDVDLEVAVPGVGPGDDWRVAAPERRGRFYRKPRIAAEPYAAGRPRQLAPASSRHGPDG